MNEAPKGKIGGLPKAVQEQVNRRMEGGEKGRSLVVWLNARPEVPAVLAAEFAGKPIREQNVSEWSQHGCQPSLRQQQALKMAQEMTLESASTPPCIRPRCGSQSRAPAQCADAPGRAAFCFSIFLRPGRAHPTVGAGQIPSWTGWPKIA
jgi:hypothetical protein